MCNHNRRNLDQMCVYVCTTSKAKLLYSETFRKRKKNVAASS